MIIMVKLNIQRFSSTNKTTHYDLSQFVSSDKPSWLNDINSDMSKIDTAIHTAKTTADGAATSASNAQTAAEGAQTTANTAVTNAATAQSGVNTNANNIGNLTNLTTASKSNLVSAINELDGEIGNVSQLTTDNKTDLVNAINSIETKVEELDNYSTSESLTGKKWVNNKPIYRKVIRITLTAQQTGTPANISNLDIVTSFGGITDGGLPINFDFRNVYYISTFMDTGVIYNVCSDGYVGEQAYIIIEYTKTTD